MNAAPATLRAGLLLLGLAPATEAAPQVPFRAHYVLGAAGFNVGTAEVHGRLDAQGRLLAHQELKKELIKAEIVTVPLAPE